MNAIMYTIVRGIVPVGSIVGGILGGPTGVVNTLHAEGIGQWGLLVFWILLGPAVGIGTQPESVTD